MSTSKKDTMREISIACVDAAHSGGVHEFLKSLVIILPDHLKTRLRTEIDNSVGGVALATSHTGKMPPSNRWWLQRLYAEDWETEVRRDALLDSYISGTRQFYTGKGRQGEVLVALLESLCPVFEEFDQFIDPPDEDLVGLKPGAERQIIVPSFRFPNLVRARICWENAWGTTEWPDGMVLADAQYDDDQAAIKASQVSKLEKGDRARFIEKRDRDARASSRDWGDFGVKEQPKW